MFSIDEEPIDESPQHKPDDRVVQRIATSPFHNVDTSTVVNDQAVVDPLRRVTDAHDSVQRSAQPTEVVSKVRLALAAALAADTTKNTVTRDIQMHDIVVINGSSCSSAEQYADEQKPTNSFVAGRDSFSRCIIM